MLKLKLHYFGHVMLRARWLEKTLMLGEMEGKSRRGHMRMRWLNRVTDAMDMNLRKLWGIVEDSEAWCTAVHGVTHSWAWLRDSANTPRLTPRACIPELSNHRIRSLGFSGGASGRVLPQSRKCRGLGLTPVLGRSPERECGNPLHYSCWKNPHGQRSLEGYSPWSCKESDMTEVTEYAHKEIL